MDTKLLGSSYLFLSGDHLARSRVAACMYPPLLGNALRLRRGRRCARLMYGTGSAQLP